MWAHLTQRWKLNRKQERQDKLKNLNYNQKLKPENVTYRSKTGITVIRKNTNKNPKINTKTRSTTQEVSNPWLFLLNAHQGRKNAALNPAKLCWTFSEELFWPISISNWVTGHLYDNSICLWSCMSLKQISTAALIWTSSVFICSVLRWRILKTPYCLEKLKASLAVLHEAPVCNDLCLPLHQCRETAKKCI